MIKQHFNSDILRKSVVNTDLNFELQIFMSKDHLNHRA